MAKRKIEKTDSIDLDVCRVCHRDIKVQAYTKTGFCSDNCVKKFKNEAIASDNPAENNA